MQFQHSKEWNKLIVVIKLFTMAFNSLPNGKNFRLYEIERISDDQLNVAKMTIFLFERAVNTVGKGENAGYQHFLLFPQCFPKASSSGLLKVGIVW